MTPAALNVGRDVPSIFSNDLAVEMAVVQHLWQVIALCESEQDFATRELLVPMLATPKSIMATGSNSSCG